MRDLTKLRTFQLADEAQEVDGATQQFTASVGLRKNSMTANSFYYADDSIAEEASECILHRHTPLLKKLAS